MYLFVYGIPPLLRMCTCIHVIICTHLEEMCKVSREVVLGDFNVGSLSYCPSIPPFPLDSYPSLLLSFLPPPSQTQSPGSTRSSRIYPVRRSTVVVQGEKLVIRKLVVAGIVSAEKSYLDCLNVMKEVCFLVVKCHTHVHTCAIHMYSEFLCACTCIYT